MRPLLLLAGGLLATGCLAPSPEGAPDADATEATRAQSATALVVVERSTGPADTTREAVVARFLRARAGTVDDQALRIAGLVRDLPAPGTCAPLDDTAALPSAGDARRALELLDVGALAFEGPQSRAVLAPRAMPDPAGVVSGYFYSSRSAEAFTPGARFSLRAAGSADVESFTATVNAPADFTDVRAAASGTGVEVSWDAPSDPRDTAYLDVLAPAPRVVARCNAADATRFVVPSNVVGMAEEGQIAVHRVHREAFRAKGVDPGEIRFDVARVVPFRR